MTKNPQINITLGTAGHIDHGKTALVKLMTGCDTDRLKIEKERGMTIELGFAPCMISNMEIGIVDVPGHEHFIKTMVAGATGIDGVIFVIAADDSIMPQTREHLDILTLLGVQHGLVALTKIDMVNDDRLELVTDQISQFLKGTFLQDKAICPISNITGKGFDGFLEALKQVVAGIKPKPVEGIFRLPVEKSFSFSGFGTIVTGIPVAGHTKIGDEVVLLPANKKGRIKTIQIYSRKTDVALSGQCAAINIPQFDYKTIQRGNVVTSADYFKPSRWYLGCLDILDSAQKPLKNASIVKLHTSTAETNAKVYLLEGKYVEPGSKKILVQFCMEDLTVAGPKDRFIIRQPSPANTIGGGYIIEAIDQKIKRTDFNAVADITNRAKAVENITDFVEYCILTCTDHTARISQVSVRTKQSPDFLGNIFSDLVARSRIVPLSKELYIHSQVLNKLKAEILNLCKLFHANNPQSIGIANSELLQQSRLQNQLYNFLISDCINSGLLVTKNNCLSIASHHPVFDSIIEKNITVIENQFKENLFSPPSLHEVEQIINDQKIFRQSIKILLEQKTLIEIEKDIFFHSTAIEKIKSILAEYFKNNPQLESVKFKYLLDTSRKYALPLLDYMDRIGFTSRIGNTRFPRNIQ